MNDNKDYYNFLNTKMLSLLKNSKLAGHKFTHFDLEKENFRLVDFRQALEGSITYTFLVESAVCDHCKEHIQFRLCEGDLSAQNACKKRI